MTTVSNPATTSQGVVERLGIGLQHTGGALDPTALLGLALRYNPRRAQLLVSRVLGKHVPTEPRLVRSAGLLLGALVADALAGRAPRPLPVDGLHAALAGNGAATAALHADAAGSCGGGPDALVLGFAETATGLGHCVAEGMGGVDYLHSTRRPVRGYATAGGFTEEHSHATDHLLLPADPALLRGGRPLVLVDDELSTGRTALNTITALHRVAPREHYVVATLVDTRPATSDLVEGARALGARLDVVALSQGCVELPADLVERAAALRAELDVPLTRQFVPTRPPIRRDSRVDLRMLGWAPGLPVGGRHGFGRRDHERLASALPDITWRVADAVGLEPGARTLVLGTEELMALPLRIAQTLADSGHDVRFSATTRSPAVVHDSAGYALRSGITFPAHDEPADGPGPRYAYNLGAHHLADRAWDHVIVVVDPPADTPALRTGLLAELAPLTARTTVVVTP